MQELQKITDAHRSAFAAEKVNNGRAEHISLKHVDLPSFPSPCFVVMETEEQAPIDLAILLTNMFTKTDTITKYYQCLVGHFAISTIVIFDEDSHLASSVVGRAPVVEEAKVGLIVCLMLTKVALLIEFASISIELPSIFRSLYSALSHTLASCIFLLFIYDSHPPSYFWISFAVLSAPPCVLAVNDLMRAISRRYKHQ